MLNRAAEYLDSILKKEFLPFPKWGDPAWQHLAPEAREALVNRAEVLMEKKWETLPAHLYMDFQRNGNRSRYEAVYFERRERLLQLALAECIEGKGRFIDVIIDGLWAICEETSWVIPAHNNQHGAPSENALPNFMNKYPYVDLFSAETASALTWIYYLLADRLSEESPLIPLRVEKEIKERVFDPFMALNDMHWMGLDHNRPVNNWNPWINSNVLAAFLVMEKDEQRRLAGVRKVAQSAQRFLDFYAEDGGCDEGPSYFNVAGGAMLDILELFYDATDGQMSLYDEPLIRNMADYIRHVHIAGPYFVNFADAPSRISNVAAGCLLRAGRLTQNDALVNFAREMYRDQIVVKPWSIHYSNVFRQLKTLLTYSPSDACPEAPSGSDLHYFPGIQVPVVRSKGGLFFAAKGGNNQESHNHNDIGNYILYANGQPCVVDAGVGAYSKKTFSSLRYTIWSMQSGYHNTSIVNGCDQHDGEQYAAHSVSFTSDEHSAHFALNIERAYPEAAKLDEYRREFVLDREKNTLTLTDRVRMSECTEPVTLPILCYLPPVIGEGTVEINGVTLHFDPEQFTARFEEVSLDDAENPITCWQKDSLYRLLLTRTDRKATDQWSLAYTMN